MTILESHIGLEMCCIKICVHGYVGYVARKAPTNMGDDVCGELQVILFVRFSLVG